jgi:hypothetical protein
MDIYSGYIEYIHLMICRCNYCAGLACAELQLVTQTDCSDIYRYDIIVNLLVIIQNDERYTARVLQ